MDICITDFEATCWDNIKPEMMDSKKSEMEIIEIGCVLVGIDLEEISTFQMFVKPVIRPVLSVYCKNLTHITQEQVDGAPLFPEAVERLVQWLDDEAFSATSKGVLFASWGKYDCRQLEKDCKYHKVEYPFIPEVCLDIKNHYARKKGFKPGGLSKAVRCNNIQFKGEQHRALTDAIATHEVLKVVGL